MCYVEESRPPLWSSGQSSWLHNRAVLWFLWGRNWIYICCVAESRPPQWSSGQSSWLQNGDVLCFLRYELSLYVCYVEESRPPLWSSGQSSWLQILRSGFDSRRYQIFWEVVGLERGPLSPESREYGRRNPLFWPRNTLYPQKLALTSSISDGHSVGIVCSCFMTFFF
jgi:hypothetical protein